ncbi:MAG: serine racemase VanT catalytic subunit [Lachnospira sp.]|jgi:serine/alanine racemase|nr:serine racemase VanT catalytic subunit [Lachnospira sp.]
MKKSGNYSGIDCFRMIAALLIVAIHTSPLLSFNETADFILTRIIGRVAVPFFFMTSGFFLISRYSCNNEKLKTFIKKTAVIYGIAIVIYIPINIYKGYFSMDNLLLNIIKDIIFDGTFYHLWYLPASIIGAALAWYMVRRLGYSKALIISALLYIVGLFGDSYFGIAEQIEVLKQFYSLIFQVSDYTRNGIFFAPIFFVLGGMIADTNVKRSLSINGMAFAGTFALMVVEAMTLHTFNVQRHDSMYIFLPVCMFFLFHLLLYWKERRFALIRMAALIVYIIHPMMIVIVHFLAKFLGDIIVENSLINYLIVCLLSVLFSIVATIFINKFTTSRNSIKKKWCFETERAWIELNLDNLAYNVNALQKVMAEKSTLMAVVKTQAYGHGAFQIATFLNQMGVKAFAVATIDEGIQLRRYGICGEILILGYTNPNRAKELKKYDLMQTLIDFKYAKALNRQKIAVKAHIKIDTGMNRLGVSFDNINEVKMIFSMKYIKVCGIYTHLCCADTLLPEDVEFSENQIDNFYYLIDKLKERGIQIPKVHIQSSYGLLNYPQLVCDYVRVGIALYGVLSKPDENTRVKIDLRPVLSLKARVVLIRSVSKQDTVSYGRRFQAKRDSLIAIVSIGYGDGFPRDLSCQKGGVLIRGQYAPIVGRICMDQLAVDITEIEDVSVGNVATLIGFDTMDIAAPDIAQHFNSISNELLCRMGARLPIIIK